MANEIKTGGPAFPFVPGEGSSLYELEGMTLHDYFSAKAMAAIISNSSLIDDLGQLHVDWVVGHSRAVADAMIKARG
ncbi:TPA: hypothetical protein PXL93_004348 [Yersinia enterocolitica]|nr:hypothetical protein [Yersinia enterocolitica]HDL6901593.1 hypothetical protein [Yersinia enterocolitica]HDL7013688.1 hypothetical protein [Yersinia enterocolitica]